MLELAIGTGRIALPLAAAGLEVDGIDFAPEMLKRLEEKPGGTALKTYLGDFADVAVEGSYRLVFVVWNSFFTLLDQDDQLRCFENVAAHLSDDGLFLIEGYYPRQFHRLIDDQQVNVEDVQGERVRIGVLKHDAARQTIEQNHVTLSVQDGITMNPVAQRYVWPSELDLMARLAGLELKHRWSGWKREPVTADSTRYVSVYGR